MKTEVPLCRRGPQLRMTPYSYALATKMLWTGCTQVDIVEATGLAYATIGRYLRNLATHEMLQVVDVLPDKNGKRTINVYRLGPGDGVREYVSERTLRRRAAKRKAEAAHA